MIHGADKMFRRFGFSLIELLIVVSIITILTGIAIPNFLDAQTRSKVARTKADMRTMAMAVESYYVDASAYPFRRNTLATATIKPEIPEMSNRIRQLTVMTTPIAYLTDYLTDVFEANILPPNRVIDYYDPTQVAWLINSRKMVGQSVFVTPDSTGYLLVSVGPDGYLGPFSDLYSGVTTPFELQGTIFWPYDPSNGTTSPGNLYYSPIGGIDHGGDKFMQKAFAP